MIEYIAHAPEWMCHVQAIIQNGTRVPLHERPAGIEDIPNGARDVITTCARSKHKGGKSAKGRYVYDVIYRVFLPEKKKYGGWRVLDHRIIGRIESDEYLPTLRTLCAGGAPLTLEGKLITLRNGQQRRVHIDESNLPLPLLPQIYERLYGSVQ